MADTCEIMSLCGRMRPVFVPENLGITDPQEIGEALLAYRHRLSPDDVRLLRLILTGLTNDEIAQHLQLIESKSVKHRIQSLYNKLGVTRRTEAALRAANYGLRPEKNLPTRETGRR